MEWVEFFLDSGYATWLSFSFTSMFSSVHLVLICFLLTVASHLYSFLAQTSTRHPRFVSFLTLSFSKSWLTPTFVNIPSDLDFCVNFPGAELKSFGLHPSHLCTWSMLSVTVAEANLEAIQSNFKTMVAFIPAVCYYRHQWLGVF